MSRAPRGVLFDLDGTLLRYERPPGAVLEASFSRVGVDAIFPVEAYYERFDAFAERTDSMTELRSECFAALAREHGYDSQLGREIADAFEAERDQSNVTLRSGVATILDRLAGSYSLALVTNGAKDAQREKIDAVGLGSWFEVVVIAGRDVPPKPDPAPVELAVEKLGIECSEAVFVGDSIETDMGAAAAAGVTAVWVADDRQTGHATVDFRIDSVADLLPPPWD